MKLAFLAGVITGLVGIVNAWTGYQVGSTYEYNFGMNVDINGQTPSMRNDDGMVAELETRNSKISVEGTVAVRCLQEDPSNYLLEMEILNVVFGQTSLQGEINEEIGTRNHREVQSQINGKRALFVQNRQGNIIDIVETPDSKSSSLSWLYVGLINSFQTHIIGHRDVNGRWMVADVPPIKENGVLVDDITGIHTADVTRSVDKERHVIHMEFDESDYSHFTDRRVDVNKVEVDGFSTHWLNEAHNVFDEIHVKHSSSFQTAELETTDLGATGVMKLKLRGVRQHTPTENEIPSAINRRSGSKTSLSRAFPVNGTDEEGQLSRSRSVLREFMEDPSDMVRSHMLAMRMTEHPNHVSIIDKVSETEDINVRRTMMLALVCANNVEAQKIMLRRFIKSEFGDKSEVVIMASMFTNPSRELVSAVKYIAPKELGFAVEAMEAKFEGRFEKWQAAQQPIIPNSDGFDKQKSGSWSKSVGPKDLHVDLAASYFAGTDFTACGGGSGTDLNVKVGASASAKASVFGHSKSVIDIQAWYVILSGQTVQNAYSLSVFGNTVTSGKVFPYEGKACPPHVSKNIWSASPGFGVTYTMVVVAVPVQFSAGITAQLNLAYGYDICPQNLKASVDLEPGVTVVASATAQVSLVLAHAGITLAGSINQQVRPTAFLNMNGNCQLGAKVDLVAAPTTLRFYGFYGYRSCKFHHWHLSCGWHDSTHDFWSWQNSGSSSTVWSDTCYFNRHSSPMFSCGH